ncbi:MAG TPA: 4-(cytidine 5'-diphospho)-2-C-methyl-D-erythritol kinase [Caulobacteraceae bacterium]|nr:4-(cytidine 5'-diphospho)-2-C-methyl-D-erythritol kinase [Caulobacteraceae bacterium]
MSALERLAPAKVNLFLHVGAVGADGYHPLSSLMTFADVGDVVAIEPARQMAFEITGPMGEGLSAAGDNLVVRARDAMLRTFGLGDQPFRLTLDKRLPIAAGIGGGSTDAAATLLLIQETFGLPMDDETWGAMWQIACELGADVPVCLVGEAKLGEGRGDEIDFPPVFPDLDAVLVNPGVPSPTGPVFRAYDEDGAPGGCDTPEFPEPMQDLGAVTAFLRRTRNDLEAPAIRLTPQIGEALAILRAQPETAFARMSGSGATCFALTESPADAADLALRLSSRHPGWWVKACRLKGFRP